MKKKRHPFINMFVVIVVVFIAGFLFYKEPYQKIKQKAVGDALKSELISRATELTGLSDEQVEDILSVIPEDQQEEIVQIAADHVTPSTISDVTEMVKEKDYSGIIDYAQNELTTQEKEQVEEIALSNQDALAGKLAEYGYTADTIASLMPSFIQ